MTPIPPPLPTSGRRLLTRFRAAQASDVAAIAGDHRAQFIGSRLLRASAPKAIALGGMPGWHGKRFAASGEPVLHGHNLLRGADGALREVNPMTATVAPSWADGRPAIVVSYAADGPRPWRWVRDEFRPVEDGVLLGVTFALSPRLRALAAFTPFLLVRDR